MSPTVRFLISGTLLLLTVLGLMNVYADTAEVEALAKRTACIECDPRLEQVGRTPISHTYHFRGPHSELFVVSCARPLIFVGDYECKLDGN